LGSKRISVTRLNFGLRDVIAHVTIGFRIGNFLLAVLWNQLAYTLTVSEILNGECDAMIHVTLNDL